MSAVTHRRMIIFSVFVFLLTRCFALGRVDKVTANASNHARTEVHDDFKQPVRRPDISLADKSSKDGSKTEEISSGASSQKPKDFRDIVPYDNRATVTQADKLNVPGSKRILKSSKAVKSDPSDYWNAWKGDSGNGDSDDSLSDTPFDSDFLKGVAWKEDAPWNPEQMMMNMMMMKTMKGMKGMADSHDNDDEGKKDGLLSKLKSDPVLLLVASLIPLGLICTAVLPILFNMWMNGQNIPTFVTTATGTRDGNFREERSSALLNSVLEALSKFRNGDLHNAGCMQRSLCQMFKGNDGDNEAGNLNVLSKNVLKASAYVDDSWLEALGIKSLLSALDRGKCEEIPCSFD